MKKILLLILSIFLLSLLGACGNKSDTDWQDSDNSAMSNSIPKDSENATDSTNSIGAFISSNVHNLSVPEFDTDGKKAEKTEFENADIMTFQTVSIKEFLDDMIAGEIEANNNQNDTITNLKIYVSILDVSGIERGIGEASCDYAVEAGKKVLIEGIFDVDKDSVEKIVVTGYDYTLQGQKYHIDLINSEAVKWEENVGTSDFDTKNILTFTFEPTGTDNESYGFKLNTTNGSDYNINVVECRVIFLDSENNQLHEMNGYTKDLKASSTNTNQHYSSSLEQSTLAKISKLGVSSYTYWFDATDADGYKGYKIDLINITATGLSE